MKIDGMLFIVSIMVLALIPGVYGTTVGGGTSLSTSGGCSASGNFVASNTGVVGQSSSTGTGIANLADNHWVANKAGAFAIIDACIKGATKPYTYSYSMYPGEHEGKKTSYVDASENLNVPNAAQIDTYAEAYNLAGYATSVSTDVTGGSLLGYQNSAWASADKVDASQTFDTATGTIKTNSGSYTWLILPETGINTKVTGEVTNYKDDASKSKSTGSSQASQVGHVAGSFTSTAKSGTNTKTRTSNYGTKYDLNMQAGKDSSGSSVSGVVGYYVDPSMATAILGAIQGGVNAAQSGDTINAAAGTYKENVAIDKSLAVNGAGAGTYPTKNTIVDGNQAGSVFTIGIADPSANVALSGMTIQGGTGTLTEWIGFSVLAGGGIWNAGALMLNDITIRDNKAYIGGGIYNDGMMAINGGSSIKGNTATHGGGIFNNDGTLTMNGGSITGNIATSGGGGIYNDDGTLTMNGGSSIKGNTANNGGGIVNGGTVTMNGGSSIKGNIATSAYGGSGGGILNVGTMTMNGGSSITDNIATLGGGGGILNDGTLTMNGGSSIKGNTAGDGGGIYNEYDGTMTMNGGSSITDNIATFAYGGGGILNVGTMTMNGGSSIKGNIATSAYYGSGGLSGGGILNMDGTVTMNGGSITDNSAYGYGGGIYSSPQGSVTFDGTQVAIKNNKAHLPATESSWYQGWGVYLVSGTPITTGGFDPTTQVTGNTQI